MPSLESVISSQGVLLVAPTQGAKGPATPTTVAQAPPCRFTRSNCSAGIRAVLFLGRMTLRLVEIAHSTHNVSLRILELDQLTDGGNRHLGYGYLAPLASD